MPLKTIGQLNQQTYDNCKPVNINQQTNDKQTTQTTIIYTYLCYQTHQRIKK